MAGPDCFYSGLCGSMVVCLISQLETGLSETLLSMHCCKEDKPYCQINGMGEREGRISVRAALYNVPTKPNPDPSTTSFALRI